MTRSDAVVLFLLCLLACPMPVQALQQAPRLITFSYEMLAADFPTTEAVDIYLPLPAEGDAQQVLSHDLHASIPGDTGLEAVHGNGYYHIHFTTGRDLVFSPGSAAQPLNYFIYPYVEVGGKPWRFDLKTRFGYRDLTQ